MLREVPELAEAATIVGVAGTIISIAAVELGRYDREALHHFVLTRDAAEDVFRTLATEPLADRVHNPGLPAGTGRHHRRWGVHPRRPAPPVARLRARSISQTDLLDALARQLALIGGSCRTRR